MSRMRPLPNGYRVLLGPEKAGHEKLLLYLWPKAEAEAEAETTETGLDLS